MALRILNRSFSGGEITPELFGRLDLSKVQEALARCLNFITLPHGPVVNRPGTEFIEEVKDSMQATRLIPFSYDNEQTFAIQAGAGYFRFHAQGGTLQCGTPNAYAPSATVAISLANPAVVTWNSHGLAAGAAVSFASSGGLPAQIAPGATYYVVNPTANTFQLATTQLAATSGGPAISTAAPSSAVTISIASPGVVTWNNHGLASGTPVVFSTTGALPTGIAVATTYYVVSPTANAFEIAATPGGAAINTSGTQSGTQTCAGTQAGTQTGSLSYQTGDLVSSGGVNYYCTTPNANQAPPNAGYWYAQPANGDYEIPSPYAAADLMDIHYTQSADVLTLAHPNHPIMELRRYGATDWKLLPVTFSPAIAAPAATSLVGSPIAHTYAIQSYVQPFSVMGTVFGGWGGSGGPVSCSNDLTQPGAYNMVSWTPVQGATSYGVYKIINGAWYWLGMAAAYSFKDDANVAPQSVASPATPGINLPGTSTITATPYSASGINAVTATPTGSGSTSYSYQVTALDENGNESGPSSAAACTNDLTISGNRNTLAFPAVSGAIRYNVYKMSYGVYGFIGQVAPTSSGALSFVDNNITADISRTPPVLPGNTLASAGNYPAAVAYYQQRRIFAGTLSQPQNVWATRSGTEADLTYTLPSRDDNRLAFRIAAREASAIRHIVPLNDLLFLSASCEWRCSSSAGVLTPSTINVQPQSYVGANNVQPVVVGNAVLYAAARGGHLRQMGYNWQINGYQSTDASIFAPHLFDYNTILDMAYSRGPVPILWCVSSSGRLLGMTWLPEQQIAAWHQHATGANDVFESICTISEAPAGSTAGEDMLYCIVRRTINGASKRYVERLHTRLYNTLADAHYVDCGYTYTAPVVSGTYTLSGNMLTCSIANHGLTNGNTYWFAFSDSTYGATPGGMSYVVTVIDANTFSIQVATTASASGTVTWLPNALTGLTWLNGMTVNILADGAVLPQQVVTNNSVTFPVGVSVAHIGLPITAQVQTPPAAQAVDAAMAQGMAKNINRVFLRTYRSSGILAGPDFNSLVPYRQRSTENPGSPPAMVSDEVEIVLDAAWGASGQVCIQQSDPLPLDIAAMTLEIATGGGV